MMEQMVTAYSLLHGIQGAWYQRELWNEVKEWPLPQTETGWYAFFWALDGRIAEGVYGNRVREA